MEEADKCIALKPEWAKGFFRKGMVYFQQEKYIDAAETFYRGCELDPTDVRLSEMVCLCGLWMTNSIRKAFGLERSNSNNKH